jgi:penicillin-binding protein 1A
VLAMVGGRSYSASQFNRVTSALRQPGSAFKPVVYLPALEAGMTPDSRVLDGPITVDGWTPKNFAGEYRGAVTLREAVARSLNTVAVRVSEEVGRAQVVQAARRLGITALLEPHPSIALGAVEVTPLEMAAAYAVFANGGYAVEPYGVLEVRQGADVLYRRTARSARRVVSAETAGELTDMLRSVVDWGTGRAAGFGVPVAGKTGTSQDFRDAWFVGYGRNIVVAVWVGNDSNAPMNGVTGSSLPAVIWKAFMAPALNVGIAEAEHPPESMRETMHGSWPAPGLTPEREPSRLDLRSIPDQIN